MSVLAAASVTSRSAQQPLRWEAEGLTDVGRVRKLNEDALLLRNDVGLWAVADGMGGHSCGEIASNMVVSALNVVKPVPDLNRRIENIEARLVHVNEQLLKMARKSHKRAIGSTVVALVVHGHYGVFLWAGDSRLYRLRDGILYQLTLDHSQVADYVREGLITADEAVTHRLRNRITRAVGAHPKLYLDLDLTIMRPRDRYLLCSDGLNGYVTDAQIYEILDSGEDAKETCGRLIDTTLAHNAGDNVTTIIVDIM